MKTSQYQQESTLLNAPFAAYAVVLVAFFSFLFEVSASWMPMEGDISFRHSIPAGIIIFVMAATWGYARGDFKSQKTAVVGTLARGVVVQALVWMTILLV